MVMVMVTAEPPKNEPPVMEAEVSLDPNNPPEAPAGIDSDDLTPVAST